MKNTLKHTLLWSGGIFSTVTLLAGFLLMQLHSNVAVAAPTVRLYVAPTSSTITQGGTGSIQVRLAKNTADKVDYVNARLTFSSGLLEVVGVSRQGSHFTYANGPAITYNNANGTIAISGTGALLDTKVDVLVATIAFRGRSAGTSPVSFSSVSQAGDMTNGGHVKNELDGMSNGSVVVAVPSATSTPAQPNPTPQAPGTTNTEPDETIAPGEEVVIEQGDNEQGDSSTQTDGIVTGTESTPVSPAFPQPLWARLVPYVAAGAGVLALMGFGGAWFIRRRQQGSEVDLPPIDANQELGIVMPTTVESDSPVEDELSPDYEADEAGVEEAAEAAPLPAPIAPTAESSVGPAETGDDGLAPRPVEYTPPAAVAAAPAVPTADPLAAALEAPLPQPPPESVQPAAAPYQSAVMPPALSATAPASQPRVAAMQTPPPAAVAQASPPVTAEPLPAPVAATPTGQVDYANLPDMFDIGEARLKAEGFGVSRPVK